MTKKACQNCGVFFNCSRSQKKFCSDNCRWNYHDRRKKIIDKPFGITLPYIPDRLIVKEGETYDPS